MGLIFRFAFSCLIFFGLFQLFSSKLKVKNDHLPFTVLSSIGLIMFVSGLLNIMADTFMLIVSFSLIWLLYLLVKREKIVDLRSNGIMFFILGSVFLALILKGNRLYEYDDFSHWALVVREMLAKNRLPNFTDDLIIFQAYPTGSAGIIYFFSKLWGNTEAVMLYAQAVFYLSCISPLFSFINTKKISHYAIIMLYAGYAFFYNYGLRTLYVDTILTLVTVAITAILLDAYFEDKLDAAILPTLIGNSLLIIVKNSGILFVVINTLLYLVLILKKKSKVSVMSSLFLVVGPFITRHLWNKHTELVFANSGNSKHAISADGYQQIFASKSTADIQLITNKLIERSMDFNDQNIKLLFLIIIFISIILVMRVILKNKHYKFDLMVLLSIVGLYGLYQCGLLFTYLYSMPTSEALVLASYGRYNVTMIGYLVAIFILYYFIISREGNPQRNIKKIYTGFLVLILSQSLLSYKGVINTVITNSGYENSPRKAFLETKAQVQIDKTKKIVVYVSNLTNYYTKDYLYYQMKFDLGTADIQVIDVNDLEMLKGEFGNNNMALLLFKEDDLILDMLEEHQIFSDSRIINFGIGE